MKQAIADAAARLENGEIKQALVELDSILNKVPGQPDARLLRAVALGRVGGSAEAIAALGTLTQEQPKFAAAWYNLGVLQLESGEPAPALASFRRSLDLNPNDYPSLVNAGAAANALGEWGIAADHWSDAEQQRPGEVNVAISLGVALTHASRYDEARARFESVLSADPRSVAALNGMGMTWRASGNTERALQCYDRALEVDPASARTRVNRAKALIHAEQFESARADFALAYEAEPGNPEAVMGLSVTASKMGDRPTAIEHARTATILAPKSVAALFNLAALLSKETEPEKLREADGLLRQALGYRPTMAEAWHCEAQVLGKLGPRSEATQAARRAVELAPDEPVYALTLADLLTDSGSSGEALVLLRSECGKHTHVAEVHRQLGIAELRAGDFEPALNSLERAYRLGEDDQRTIAYLGLALAHVRGTEAARQWLGIPEVVHETTLPTPPSFDSLSNFNAALAEAIRNHSALRWEPIGLAAVNGALTDDLLADRNPATLGFARSLRSAIERYKATLTADANDPFLRSIPSSYQLNIWATLVEAPGQIDTHIHEESWLSGAYYVELPDSIRPDNEAGWIEFGRPHSNDPLSDNVPIDLRQPLVGKLLLFPSYVFHRTIPHQSGQRISVSFDLVPD